MIFLRILLIAAVVPALMLLKYVYNADHLEKEPRSLLVSLVFAGVISTLIAMIGELIGQLLLAPLPEDSLLYRLLMYFVIVGGSEEGAKYFVLKRKTWNSEEFNCQFDGVVYSVFVSLGFALWENIKYVLSFGFGTALVRAVTAVPGHACFGVFMGFFYSLARRYENYGMKAESSLYRKLAVFVPLLIHGSYDFIATDGSTGAALLFFAFVFVLFFVCFNMVKKLSQEDMYID